MDEATECGYMRLKAGKPLAALVDARRYERGFMGWPGLEPSSGDSSRSRPLPNSVIP